MISSLVSLYSFAYPTVLVYMLQASEYRVGRFLRWYWRTGDFNKIMYRNRLQPTRYAKLLVLALRIGMSLQIIAAGWFVLLWRQGRLAGGLQIAAALVVSYPVIWAHLIALPLVLARIFIVTPKQRRLIKKATAVFANHPAKVIAVAGSYGKTTVKELLATVLAEGLKVAATTGNRNVASSISHFALGLKGDEKVLIVEYGEAQPGDIEKLNKLVRPAIGVITGLAPAHLDNYPTIESAGKDIFNLSNYLNDKVFVNGESVALKTFIKEGNIVYSRVGTDGWQVLDAKTGYDGTSFVLRKNTTRLLINSELLGLHQIGPLALSAVIASELGLSKAQIERGAAKTVPFEHRMQPRTQGGAWVIDDTYNGNIDGVKAGLDLLKHLPAKRKIYVTPGLVDQGTETEKVHLEIGQLIAKTRPDLTVLMQNSVTELIKKGLRMGVYKGELRIETDPLHFYSNLDQFVAAGDLVLMQNDWPDQYS